jgi:hypothetical protein
MEAAARSDVGNVLEIWTYGIDLGHLPTVDLTGYSVAATDGEIGKVDEATYETGGSYIIVDTGPWIFGKKVMLPAGVVRQIDADKQLVHVDRSKQEIKNAPMLDPDPANRDQYRSGLAGYYTSSISDHEAELEADGRRQTG